MRLCYVADIRSPIARNWITHFAGSGHEVHVISSYQGATVIDGVRSTQVVPLALSNVKARLQRLRRRDTQDAAGIAGDAGGALLKQLSALLSSLGLLDALRHKASIRRAVSAIEPDLVHAMRVPFEGIAAAEALRTTSVPLLISVWGNDFTLHARRNGMIGYFTRRALGRADAIHPDARRDLRLAMSWGFAADKPAVVLPSGGGVQRTTFHSGPASFPWRRELAIPDGAPVIVNSRGFREYVRNDTFFQAIPLVLKSQGDAVFVCPAMRGSRVAEQWLRRLGIGAAVRLLPSLKREELADLFRLADLTVSLTEHDGTPNTLLEAMACGAFPVVGDLESVREWIVDGENGVLCDARDAEDAARAMGAALGDRHLRMKARVINGRLVGERAEHGAVMSAATAFYGTVINESARFPGLRSSPERVRLATPQGQART